MTEFEKWARIEIALALNANDEDHEYMADCYKSALKAFKALLNDGHSGCSISITKNILNRLIERKPLSPILGTCNEWGPVSPKRNKDGWKEYRNIRYPSLYKYVYSDGSVKYYDTNYCAFTYVDSNTGTPVYHSGYLSRIIHDLYPIIMPYYPSKPIIGYTEDCLFDTKNGDFDTMALYYIIKDGERIEINKFFKENGESSPFTEISKEEFEYRLSVHNKRIKENKNE